MAETVIRRPGAGQVRVGGKSFPKTYVYAGLAAVAGIAVYAYWTHSGGLAKTPEPTFDEFGNPIAGPTPGLASPTVLDSNLSTQVGTGFTTNADWSQFAIDHLQGLGLNGPAVSSAIGKFLQRRPLTAIEADFVGQAVAVAGWPPEGRPWTIIPATAVGPVDTGPKPPAAPTGVRATGGKVTATVTWRPVVGAASYEIRAIRGGYPGTGTPWRSVGLATSHTYTLRVARDSRYGFGVRARNAAGVSPETRSNVVTVRH